VKRNMDIRSDAGQASPKGEGISVDWALCATHQDEGRVEAPHAISSGLKGV